MSLPSPIEMPSPLPVNSKSFDLNFPQEITPVGQGFIQTIDRGPSLWVAQYTTPPLNETRESTFQAFLDSLEGAQFTFLAFDPRRPRPLAYKTSIGSEPWALNGSGAPRVTGVSYSGSTISIDRLTVGAVLTAGDYISFLDGNIWRLYRATENKTADGSGAISSIKVKPRPQAIGANRTLRLTRAACAMKIVGGIKKTDRMEDPGPSYSFAAVQFIDRST